MRPKALESELVRGYQWVISREGAISALVSGRGIESKFRHLYTLSNPPK